MGPDGTKELIALEDGYPESTESWKTLLRDLKRRGLPAPKLSIADGALGFWAALREGYPPTEAQRCWVHKIANVLDNLPKRLHLRTTNTIESTFAIVKARTRTTKGSGSRAAGLAMAFKLLAQAKKHWRRVNSPHLVALVHAGVKFPDGKSRILPDLPSDVVVNEPVDVTSEVAIHDN